MGREIRRVPKGWEHPRGGDGRNAGNFKPLLDKTFKDAANEWWSAAVKWHNGEVDEFDKKYLQEYPWYWQLSGDPPDEECYRPEFSAPADCYQVYETVSEGTPVSPVFKSVEAMIHWMTQPIDRTSEYNNGKDWQCMQGMTLAQAKAFCKSEYSLSMIFTPQTGLVAGHRYEEKQP